MKKRYLLSLIFAFVVLATWAEDTFEFDPGTKYRIECLGAIPSSVTLGANHYVNSPLSVANSYYNYLTADCYWYIKEEKTGKFSIRNASTYQYLTFDYNHTDSPQKLRYVHLSSALEGETSLWEFATMNSSTYGKVVVIRSAHESGYYMHMRTNYVLGPYQAYPDNTTFQFRFYTSDGKSYDPINSGTVDPGPGPVIEPDEPEPVVIDSSKALMPIGDDILFIYRADGKVDAIPQEYISSRQSTKEGLTITTVGDTVYSYKSYEVDSVSTVSPALPVFESFKFNNKFNHHMIGDAPGIFNGDTLITATVVGIGKNLRPSFKLADDVCAYIYDVPQVSKKTSARFANDVVYTVARHGQTILRRNLNGDYVVRPYGRDYRVSVDFATDHSTGAYRVPTVYITTDNGTNITSKNYWWSGRVRIDGAGVFPDMEETPMQIKGRGNSSWTSTGKAPYHMKFETAVKPFGLTKGKHWNLLANALKGSMECNAIAMKAAQLVETAGFNHMIPVEVYVNGQYRGSYNFTEKVGFANNSIDLADETYSAMYELDSYYDGDTKFTSSPYSLPVNMKEPDFQDTENPTPLTLDMVSRVFNRSMKALYDQEDVEYYFDLNYLAKFLFVDELTCNYELFHPKSTFCYARNVNDSSTSLIFGPCWDYDWCFGGPANYFVSNSVANFWEKSDGAGRVWAKAIRYNPGSKFNKIYYRLWHNFVHNDLDELVDFVEDYYNFVKYSYSHDDTKWSKGDAEQYAQLKDKAKSWLVTRANSCLDFMSNDLGYANFGYLNVESETPTIGDVNGDGTITAADLVCALNYMLGLPNEDFSFSQADTDHNEIITIADLQKIRMLNKSVKSNGFYGLPEADAAMSAGSVAYTPSTITVPLTINVAEGKYSGIQFDLNIPAGMTIEDLDISKSIPDFDISIEELDPEVSGNLNGDTYRVCIYGPGSCQLPIGKSTIDLYLGWGSADRTPGILSATMSDVMFVSSMAEDHRSVPAMAQFTADELTGINSAVSLAQQNGTQLTFRATEAAVLPIYTLDGRIFRLYNLQPGTQTVGLPRGIYIINKQKISVR